MKKIFAFLATALFPAVALAHTGAGESSGVVHGFMHPFSGLDHLLAMVSVGFLAYVIGVRGLWLIPAAFVAMMAVGGFLGMSGFDLPYVELGISLSIVVIGMCAALGLKMPVAASMALVGAFAIFHGFAHGAEMPQDASALAYGLGFMLATALLHAAGIAACFAVAQLAFGKGQLVARLGGGATAIAGAAILAGSI
jgi:urease accessory protein